MLEILKKENRILRKVYIGYILIYVLIIIVLFLLATIINRSINYTKNSIEGQKELLKFLEIEDAPSFKFISIEKDDTGLYDKEYGLELKFKISKEDYEKNPLEYYDCSDGSDWGWIYYISEIKNDIYTCVVQGNEMYSKEVYDKIKQIRENYCSK